MYTICYTQSTLKSQRPFFDISLDADHPVLFGIQPHVAASARPLAGALSQFTVRA